MKRTRALVSHQPVTVGQRDPVTVTPIEPDEEGHQWDWNGCLLTHAEFEQYLLRYNLALPADALTHTQYLPALFSNTQTGQVFACADGKHWTHTDDESISADGREYGDECSYCEGPLKANAVDPDGGITHFCADDVVFVEVQPEVVA